jgi:hypothetical protein
VKTETTDLFKYSNCLIRKQRVANTPEEQVRQSLIKKMIVELGFPKGLISVERKIGSRRFDLVCYSKEMTPLLLVECKAGAIDEAAARQVLGYNDSVKAPFICLVNGMEMVTFWHEIGRIVSVPFLPPFKDLYEISKRL